MSGLLTPLMWGRITKLCRFGGSVHLKNIYQLIPQGLTTLQKITGDIMRKKLSSPPKPTPEEFTIYT